MIATVALCRGSKQNFAETILLIMVLFYGLAMIFRGRRGKSVCGIQRSPLYHKQISKHPHYVPKKASDVENPLTQISPGFHKAKD